jgi:hypothetical protein
MDDSYLMEDIVKNIQERFLGALSNSSSMLILDTFHGHLHEKLKVKLEGKDCVLVVIPGGMTSQLTPLDMLVSNSLKDHLRMECEAWLLSENSINIM